MGIVIKQTIRGTFWSYLGVVLGFVTTAYLFPRFLTTETVGLLGLLVAYSTLAGRIALLGLPGVTNRLFSYFRNSERAHHGFLSIALVFHLLGIVLLLLVFYIFKPLIIESNLDSSPMFVDYLYLLIPMTLATMVFLFLDSYNKVLYDAVFGTFLQEFFQRFLILAVTILFVFEWIDLDLLIILYAAVVSVKALIILLFLFFKKEIKLELPDKTVFTPELRKEVIYVGMYTLLSGLGSMIVFNLDKIIINQLLDLSDTGVYTIAFYFGSLIVLPSRPLLKISGTLIADAWKNDNLTSIDSIYRKSCLNQLIVGGFLFVGLWANIDNVLQILGDDYLEAKWVIFFIGLGYLFDMATGTNGQIINFSKYYRYSLLFIVFLIVFVIGLMYLLIPMWGIKGAALAIALSLFLNNTMRYFFLLKKFRLQPFSLNTLKIVAFYTLLWWVQQFIPQMHFVVDIVVRGTILTFATATFLLVYPISEDITNIIHSLKAKYLKK